MATSEFPAELRNLIKSSKYVHVATCSRDHVPSISLMNYAYLTNEQLYHRQPNEVNELPSTLDKANDDNNGYIIFATFDDTEKIENIRHNPVVSLLFHDWITANNLSIRKGSTSGITVDDSGAVKSCYPHNNNVANVLDGLNQYELGQISATVRGYANIIIPDTEESHYYMQVLLGTNPDADIFILAENAVIVKVRMIYAKVSDNENNVDIIN
ncbi:Uncharacterized protein RNJ44_01298 [Nakaseomyces bracarensis]|uniref:Pyridoxamine 5'-phosphate oxidase N-terminal domain-containing protein n=1 Tax=Nakaseomyces bracarensis TaxID=273131 RepID=A0ABR4NRG4_9SACH